MPRAADPVPNAQVPSPDLPLQPRRPRIVLVGWDAADWKVIHPLMDAGRMPNLQRLVERGVMANLATLKPVLSPMLWTSIATGKRPYQHGILGFTEPTPDGSRVQPVSALSRRTKALWNILNQQGLSSQVVGWWPSHPVEPLRGAMVSEHFHHAVGPPDEPWPVPAHAVHPPELAEVLAPLRINPAELGPDAILPFVPKAAEIDQDQDRRLASVMKILAECVTVHNAATWLLAHQPCDFHAVYYDAIDHFCHGFMRYRAPRQDWIRERDFELYRHVVDMGYVFHDAMLGRLVQLAGPEATIVLCSDHGFHPDHLRPRQIPHEPAGPAVEHRDHGIFLVAGPGIRKDALVHGACLLDLAPTILTLFGLPIGEDMDGKVLVDVFEKPPAVETIPSWDEVPGEDARHPDEVATDPIAARQALEQLVALGYVEELGANHERAVRRTTRELRYNLARSLMDADRYEEARTLLEELYEQDPGQYRFGIQLAMCLRALEDPATLRQLVERITRQREQDACEARDELRRLADELRARSRERAAEGAGADADDGEPRDRDADEADPDALPDARQTPLDPQLLEPAERARWRELRGLAQVRVFDLEYLLAWACLAEDRPLDALAHLKKAEAAEPTRPGLPIQIGEAYLQARRPTDALRAFGHALEIDPLNPHAHLGVARARLRQRLPRQAVEAALESVGLLYHYPLAHHVLGVALARMGRHRDAETAFRTAISLNPNALESHARLLRLYSGPCFDIERAEHHRRQVHALRDAASAPRPAPEPQRTGPSPPTATAPVPSSPSADARPLDPDRTVTVVSGLPRSGTSMVMQMLEAAGLEIATDGARGADADNPRGYYEHEAVKRLRIDAAFLGEVRGRAIKIVAPLLPFLPADHDYRVIFIERDLDEVLASQQRMLARRAAAGGATNDDALRRAFTRQLHQVKTWMARRENLRACFVAHGQVLADPAAAVRTVARFLRATGGPATPDATAMASVVDASLHRNRSSERA